MQHGLHKGVWYTIRQGNVLRGRNFGRSRGLGHDWKLQAKK